MDTVSEVSSLVRPHSYFPLTCVSASGNRGGYFVGSPQLSGAQVSTAPAASFPPTGTGMLTAPLWQAQMSLGDMMQECQAGAPSTLGVGLPHVPPGPLSPMGRPRP